MSTQNANKFQQMIRTSAALRAELRFAAQAYDGDRNDDRAVFDAVVAPVAELAGVPFDYDDAREAARSMAMALSDAELDMVAGGAADYDDQSLYELLMQGLVALGG